MRLVVGFVDVWNEKSDRSGSRQASIYLLTMIDASSNWP